jgi:hypothetical protein
MFWKISKPARPLQQIYLPYPYRSCSLYISNKYKHILFIPYGKAEAGFHVELDNIISDTWPCDFGKLQQNIEEALNRYLPSVTYIEGNWPSYNNSKAKSQKSFEFDYIHISLGTDLSSEYGKREVERIQVSAEPSSIDNTYSLIGVRHLLDTGVAQMVIDIFEGCSKIRY